ncbi:MAG: Lrp/AsnC family transcriptional regulator [Promethearchaeota archaeon]
MGKIKAISIVKVEQRKFKQVKEELEKIKEIKRILLLSGEFDIILEIEIADPEDLWNLFVDKIDIIEGIIETNTHVVIKEVNSE